jgi:competence protein ComEA
MNAAERRTLLLAFVLVLLGWGARVVPASWCENCEELTWTGTEQPEEALFGTNFPIDSLKASLTNTPIATRAEPRKAKTSSIKGILKGPIRVNSASVAELQKIKGVGPVLAQKIVDYRTRNGAFRSAADLDKVPGIGKKKLDNLLSVLIFD